MWKSFQPMPVLYLMGGAAILRSTNAAHAHLSYKGLISGLSKSHLAYKGLPSEENEDTSVGKWRFFNADTCSIVILEPLVNEIDLRQARKSTHTVIEQR
ncbi:hypothetical protein [Bifidobacterium olomucense]|uniref:hypothetical protein n=1 Tax=Bifidobacterium olomucense TaxID=2675324 RepID=UPI00145D9EF0|nr:hypothetical protein [Bifidobacterium sp. DSM 109959]